MQHPRTSDEPRKRLFPVAKLFPNMITLAALCCGLSAMRYSLDARWELVMAFIIAAAVLDGLDGRIARLLNSTSTFGAQLDSLSDFVSFGVAPGLALYMWTLHDIKRFGWAAAMFFAVCCALRLARFNTAMFEPRHSEPWQHNYFTGVPAPAGALLAMLPMVAGFQFAAPQLQDSLSNIVYLVFVGFLMISRLPTVSLKHYRIRHDHVVEVMLLVAVIVGLFIFEPWLSYTVFGSLYLLLLPITLISYRREARKAAKSNLFRG